MFSHSLFETVFRYGRNITSDFSARVNQQLPTLHGSAFISWLLCSTREHQHSISTLLQISVKSPFFVFFCLNHYLLEYGTFGKTRELAVSNPKRILISQPFSLHNGEFYFPVSEFQQKDMTQQLHDVYPIFSDSTQQKSSQSGFKHVG